MAYIEYKELVDMLEEFENMYKKEDETRDFLEKWESGDGDEDIDDWDNLLERRDSVFKEIEELTSKLKDVLRKRRVITKQIGHYKNGARYVRCYENRKKEYKKLWNQIYRKFSHINLIKSYHKKEFPSLYPFDIPHNINKILNRPLDIEISENSDFVSYYKNAI